MAKGKEALAAANRRYQAAVQHIDRLTSELAEAKIRAKEAEKLAVKVPHLEERLQVAEEKLATDSVVAELYDRVELCLARLKEWKEHDERLKSSTLTLLRDYARLTQMTTPELVEFAVRRIPQFFRDGSAISDGKPFRRHMPAGLSDDAVRRLQKLRGERGIDIDLGAAMAESMEALDAGFTSAEIGELVEPYLQEVGRAELERTKAGEENGDG